MPLGEHRLSTNSADRHGRTDRFTRYAENAAQVSVVLASVAFLASALAYLYLGHWPVTHLDYWRIYDIYLNHSWLESALLKINDHSLFFPSFISLADLRFFHGDQQLMFFLGMALLFLTVALLLVPIWRDKALSLTAKIASTLILIVGNFWMGRASIIGSGGFNCAGSLSLAGTVLAFLYLPAMAKHSSGSWATTLTVIVAGFVASFSSGSGLATWPVLLFLGWCLRLPWRSIWALMIAAVIAAIIFIFLPGSSPSPVVSHSTLSPFVAVSTAVPQLCRLLGSPILSAEMAWHVERIPQVPVESSMLSLWCGAVGLILGSAALLPRRGHPRLEKDRLEFMGLALLSFNVLVMVMIVSGRAPLIRLVPSEVAAPRYFFWSTLFWTGLAMIAIQRADPKRLLRCPVLLGALAVLIFALPRHFEEGARYRYAAKLAEFGAVSLINGACDVEEIKILFRDPKQVYKVAAQFRARRLDMFASGLQDWLGVSERNLFGGHHKPKGLKGGCDVTALLKCDDGTSFARLTGSTMIGGYVPRALVVVDANGIIRGIGRSFATNSFINRLLYRGIFPGAPFLCYIRGYDASSSYAVRGVDEDELSDEKINVGVLRNNGPTR
jgi:hypothetical protein